MPRLTAVVLPGGPEFVAVLRSEWEAGHAVAPVDPRLPAQAREAVLAALRPSTVVDAGGQRFRPGGEDVEPGDALVVTTSGTSGIPKGVVLTHDAVRASALATSEALDVDPARDCWLCCLPVAHIGGLSVITRSLVTGTPLVVHAGFDAVAVAAAAGATARDLPSSAAGAGATARDLPSSPAGAGATTHDVQTSAAGATTPGHDVAFAGGAGTTARPHAPATLTSLVPTALGRLGPDADRFRRILLGGAAPPSGLAANVVTTYGMTETGSGIVYDGRPLRGVELRIGDQDEILVRAPMLLRAYRDGSNPRDAAGWLRTGDAGRLDGEGRLLVYGRLSDMIITGGENVWPTPVEEVLASHPAVKEAAVVGIPDPEWGEQVVAYVVAEPGQAPPALAELKAWVKDRLAPWAVPKQVVVVEGLPRTPIGKVRRSTLREGFQA